MNDKQMDFLNRNIEKHTFSNSNFSILILKGSKDLSNKKLWNKFLVARANGITQYYLW